MFPSLEREEWYMGRFGEIKELQGKLPTYPHPVIAGPADGATYTGELHYDLTYDQSTGTFSPCKTGCEKNVYIWRPPGRYVLRHYAYVLDAERGLKEKG